MVKGWGPSGSIVKGLEDWELMPDIGKAAEGCLTFDKNTCDVFINSNLEDVLKEQGIERVVVCGMMNNRSVDTTARWVFNRGFETWLVKGACGTATKKPHEAGLAGFGCAFGEVLKTAKVLERLQ